VPMILPVPFGKNESRTESVEVKGNV